MHSDDALYNNYLKGDPKAYDQLMVRHADGLTLYLYGYLHDWHDAEDMMIEAFARIMVKRPRIGEGKFRAYLFRTGRNLATRFRLRRTRGVQFSLEDWNGEIADEELVDEKVLDEDRKRALQLCLDKIDPQMREALWLVYVEGMSYSEAASIMKVNDKRVDHLLQKGKKQMREELEKEGITNAHE